MLVLPRVKNNNNRTGRITQGGEISRPRQPFFLRRLQLRPSMFSILLPKASWKTDLSQHWGV